jgi:cardiolipin synthase
MMLALYVLGVVAGGAVLVFVYTTLSVNAQSRHQDRVESVPPVATELDAFLRSLAAAAGQPCTAGNTVELLQNGDEIFPPMLEAIRHSRSTVHFATYIYWTGRIPDQFAEALCDAAQRGVIVRLVLDSEGSAPISKTIVKRLTDAGCKVAWFRRIRWFDFTRYNRRTHRRILVADGVVGFTGGVGIADEWAGHAESPRQWRDTHVRVTGPAVGALQAAFADNWNLCTDELLLNARDYPALSPTGKLPVCGVVSTPTNGTSPAERVVAACVAASARTLHATNAYFVPGPAFIESLCDARARGVDVKIVVPGPYHDQPIVRRASRHTWKRLVAGGVGIYEYQPTMIHAKTMVVDGAVSLVGSINLDPRSFALNAESGVVIAEAGFGEEMERVFAADLAKCTQVDARTVASLGVVTRTVDALCYWCRAQL